MDQQKQPTAPDTKTGAEVQSTQPQQQKGNIPQDRGIKQDASKLPPPKEGTLPAGGVQKQL